MSAVKIYSCCSSRQHECIIQYICIRWQTTPACCELGQSLAFTPELLHSSSLLSVPVHCVLPIKVGASPRVRMVALAPAKVWEKV